MTPDTSYLYRINCSPMGRPASSGERSDDCSVNDAAVLEQRLAALSLQLVEALFLPAERDYGSTRQKHADGSKGAKDVKTTQRQAVHERTPGGRLHKPDTG